MDNNKLQFESKIKSIDSSIYIQEIFDTRQTHAVYNLDIDNLEKVKSILIENNCNKFRVVNVKKSRFVILCFNYKDVKTNK